MDVTLGIERSELAELEAVNVEMTIEAMRVRFCHPEQHEKRKGLEQKLEHHKFRDKQKEGLAEKIEKE